MNLVRERESVCVCVCVRVNGKCGGGGDQCESEVGGGAANW